MTTNKKSFTDSYIVLIGALDIDKFVTVDVAHPFIDVFDEERDILVVSVTANCDYTTYDYADPHKVDFYIITDEEGADGTAPTYNQQVGKVASCMIETNQMSLPYIIPHHTRNVFFQVSKKGKLKIVANKMNTYLINVYVLYDAQTPIDIPEGD